MTIAPTRQTHFRVRRYDVDPARNVAEALEISRALDAVEASYEQDRQSLTEWPGPEALKQHFLKELACRYTRDRDWLTQRLVEIHQRTFMRPVIAGQLRAH